MSRSEREAVRRIAALARLEIDAEEEERLGAQFASILDAFRSLSELDVPPAAPEPRPAGEETAPADRADEPRPSLPPGDLFANAPAREDDFYSVPKVVE